MLPFYRFHAYINSILFDEYPRNENNAEKLNRRKYEILRITPKQNLTRNYMDWIVSGGSPRSFVNLEMYVMICLSWFYFSISKSNIPFSL